MLWLAPIDGLTASRTALAARDFTALWAAGRAVAEQSSAVLSNPVAFTAYLRAMFGTGIPNQIWPYPPPILLLARPLADLPLGTGFAIYTATSMAALWIAIRVGGLSRLARIAVLLSPAVADNALVGQTGSLIAALLCGGLLLIDRRPAMSGLLLGAICIKPQFSLLLPICLIAGSRWRVALFSCIGVFTLALTVTYAFGLQPWIDFLSGEQETVSAYVGAPWHSESAQMIFSSAFMASRSLGASVSIAWAVQLAVSLCCAFWAWHVWRDRRFDTKARTAATLPLILLASPWVHTYDMPALAVSITLLNPVGLTRRALLGLVWLWPALSSLIPLSPVFAVLSVGSIAWLARLPDQDGGPEPQWA